MEKTPKEILEKVALNVFTDVPAFEKFLREIYCSGDENDIKKAGFTPSLDNVAIDGVLYTMDEYDIEGLYITFGNKRSGNQLRIDTPNNRYEAGGWADAKVMLYMGFGFFRDDINYLD